MATYIKGENIENAKKYQLLYRKITDPTGAYQVLVEKDTIAFNLDDLGLEKGEYAFCVITLNNT